MIITSFLHLVDSLHTVAEVSLPLARALAPETKKLKKITSVTTYQKLQLNTLLCMKIRFFTNQWNNGYNSDEKSRYFPVCQHMVVLSTSPPHPQHNVDVDSC